MRRLLVLVLVVLLNYPAARDAWRQHEIDSSGRAVTATVVKAEVIGRGHFVSYRVPGDSRVYAAVVDAAAFEAAQKGTIAVRVVPGSPNVNAAEGQVGGTLFFWIAGIGDAIVAGLLLVAWRRRRRWRRLLVTEVEGDLVTFTMGPIELTARAPGAVVGGLLKGELDFVPSSDVVPVGSSPAVTRLDGAKYRLVGSVRVAGSTYTELLLEHGYVLRVRSDAIAHGARPKELGEVSGEFVVNSA